MIVGLISESCKTDVISNLYFITELLCNWIINKKETPVGISSRGFIFSKPNRVLVIVD